MKVVRKSNTNQPEILILVFFITTSVKLIFQQLLNKDSERNEVQTDKLGLLWVVTPECHKK